MGMAAATPPYDRLKEMLRSAVQSVQWTYIIFWQLCPQQRVLVWGDGYYNGAIKTRKTVQPVEVSTEEAALSRSEQLRELYDSLASGDQPVTENQQATLRRPSVALSPEDLTESEWFYLMCVSFSFPPGVGLVGEAYAKKQHLWLTGAHEVDSKVFTRAILAKSAHIQTVICIPLLDGVVELGTTEKVEETKELYEHVRLFFQIGNENLVLPPPRPALSSHSSNTTLSSHHHLPDAIKPPHDTYSVDDNINEEDYDVEVEDYDDQLGNDDDEDENLLKETLRHDYSSFQKPYDQNQNNRSSLIIESSSNELLLPLDIKFGGSTNLDSDHLNLLARSMDDSCRAASTPGWSDNFELHNPSDLHLQQTSEELAPEDSRYTHTVSTILHNHFTRWSDSQTPSRSMYSTQSSFTAWTSTHHHPSATASNSQRLLKYILFTVPFLHSNMINTVDGDAAESVASRLRKTTSNEDLSGNHVLAERRRREKLNERFIILRKMVPLVTKMDKASILGDTIEYVKQLRKKIQDLEARDCRLDNSQAGEKRKIRVVEPEVGGGGMAVQVEVSIIEHDALVELQCRHRDGLLLDVMKKLRELGVEITTVQSSVDGGIFTAEMRAKVKVKKGNNGKKISITQVKKAINQVVSAM